MREGGRKGGRKGGREGGRGGGRDGRESMTHRYSLKIYHFGKWNCTCILSPHSRTL